MALPGQRVFAVQGLNDAFGCRAMSSRVVRFVLLKMPVATGWRQASPVAAEMPDGIVVPRRECAAMVPQVPVDPACAGYLAAASRCNVSSGNAARTSRACW